MNFIAQLAGVVVGLSVSAVAYRYMRVGAVQEREKQLAEAAEQIQELKGLKGVPAAVKSQYTWARLRDKVSA